MPTQLHLKYFRSDFVAAVVSALLRNCLLGNPYSLLQYKSPLFQKTERQCCTKRRSPESINILREEQHRTESGLVHLIQLIDFATMHVNST